MYYTIRASFETNVIFAQTLTTKSYAVKKYKKLCEFYKGMGRKVDFIQTDYSPTINQIHDFEIKES